MGRIICNEIQQLFVRNVPINVRGLLDSISIDALLDTRLPSGSLIRDLVKHLRVFVRYEQPTVTTTVAPVTTANAAPVMPAVKVRGYATEIDADRWQAEQESYLVFGSSLDGLRIIDYAHRKVKIDLCILGPQSTSQKGSLDRVSYNLFLAVRPIFDFIITAGGEATVRLERDKAGLGGDVTGVIKSMESTAGVSIPSIPALILSIIANNSSTPPSSIQLRLSLQQPVEPGNVTGRSIRNVGPTTARTKSRAGSTTSSAPRSTDVTV